MLLIPNTLCWPSRKCNCACARLLITVLFTPRSQGRNRHILFWGGKVIFPGFFPGVKCFFPVENSHFGKPKTNFRRFQKWKAKKKKKKKKKGPLSFCNVFHLPFSIFNLPFYNFPSFLLNFHPFSLFSLPLFSRYVSKNFPVRSLWGGTLPPPPPPPPSVTPLLEVGKVFLRVKI